MVQKLSAVQMMKPLRYGENNKRIVSFLYISAKQTHTKETKIISFFYFNQIKIVL